MIFLPSIVSGINLSRLRWVRHAWEKQEIHVTVFRMFLQKSLQE
jgi:hypothetical protein